MKQLRDRTDLIEIVAREKTLPPAVRRACLTGTVEVLGGFEEIPLGSGLSGWGLAITGSHGTTWTVAVIPNIHVYLVRLIEEIPWYLWVGDTLDLDTYSIYQGDHPTLYETRKRAALGQLET